MTQSLWQDIDSYISDELVHPDEALTSALRDSELAGLPPISVSAAQGKMLHLLALAHGSRSILEIGTLGGYSTIWLARALPKDGSVISLEINPHHAEVARANIARAGLTQKIEVRLGPALDELPKLKGPFDFIFIDADKPNNPNYFDWALKLSRKGSYIIVDNVIRKGAVIEQNSTDANVIGARRLFDRIKSEPRVSATAIQTVGSKGHDGFVLAVVL